MKKFNSFKQPNVKVYHRFLLLLGALLGFSTSIVAQYGAPMAQYKLSGTIRSKICDEPIPNIKVTAYQNPEYKQYGEIFYTDSAGHFEHIYYSDIWAEKINMFINAEDTDGLKNKGEFVAFEKELMSVRYSYYGNNKQNSQKDEIFKMEYYGKPPCKEEVLTDTILTTVPMLRIRDTLLIEPGKIEEIYGEILLDSASGDVAPVSFTDNAFIVFPNPSEGIYHISFKLEEKSLVTVYVYDTGSKMIFYNKWKKNEGSFEELIDISSFSPGTYYLVLFSGNEKFMKKLVKE